MAHYFKRTASCPGGPVCVFVWHDSQLWSDDVRQRLETFLEMLGYIRHIPQSSPITIACAFAKPDISPGVLCC